MKYLKLIPYILVFPWVWLYVRFSSDNKDAKIGGLYALIIGGAETIIITTIWLLFSI